MSDFQAGDHVRVKWAFDLNDGRTGRVIETGIRRLAEPACRVRFDDARSQQPGTANDVPVPCCNLVLIERPGQHTENDGGQP